MGCGQSHIAVIYPRKAKGKPASGSGGSDDSDDDVGRTESSAQLGPDANGQEDEESLNNNKLRQKVQISSSPLLAQAELSTSQYDFFKMLDEKIDNGPDYQPNCDFEFAIEESRLSRLLEEWQTAKQKATWGRLGGGGGSLPSAAKKLHRYHSVQSNGDLRQKQVHYCPPPPPPAHYQYTPLAYYQAYQAPPPPHLQYQYQYQYQYPAGPHQYKYHQYQASNSVVLYDKSRGGYYTELA